MPQVQNSLLENSESEEQEMKICSKCHELKQLDDFYSRKKRSDGKVGICKACWSNESKKYREENKLVLAEKSKKYREENKEAFSARRKEQYLKHRDRILAYHRKHKEHIKEVKKIYRETNKDIISLKFRQWADINRETYLSVRREKNRTRLRTDPKYRLNKSFSQRIRDSLLLGKGGRPWESLVDYSLDDLKKYLERKFLDGMSWSNYGEWHIDHIIPISAFNYESPSDRDFKRCWSLKNLQPLWAKENISKGAKLSKHFQPSLI